MSETSDRAEWAAFRRLWFGETVAQLGAFVTLVALPLVAVLQLHASALEVGIITGATYASYAVLGLPAGALVDRWSRRTIMLVTDAGRAVVLTAVPILWAAGVLRVWELYVVALLVSVGTLFFDVAYQAYLPAIVSRDKLIAGNSRLQMTASASQLAGPSVAGILVQLIGAAATLYVNAASYMVSFVSVLSIRGRRETHTAAPRDEPIRRQIAEGFSYVRGDPILYSFLGCIGQFNVLLTAEEAVFVVFLVRTVHVRPALIGVLLAGMGAGAIGGSFLAGRIAAWLGTGRSMVLGAIVGPLLGLLVPLTHKGPGLALFVVGTAGLGLTTTILRVVGMSYRQAMVPAHLLGRVHSILRTVTWGPLPLAGLLGGALAQSLGPRAALLVLSVAMVSVPLWLVVTPIWRMRDLAPEVGT